MKTRLNLSLVELDINSEIIESIVKAHNKGTHHISLTDIYGFFSCLNATFSLYNPYQLELDIDSLSICRDGKVIAVIIEETVETLFLTEAETDLALQELNS